MNVDGSDVVRLTDAAEPGYGGRAPTWSPDGTKIAFTSSDDSGGGVGVWLMDANGTNQVKLTDGSNPSWAPDGSRILLVSSAEVFSMNTDGLDPTNLTNRPESHELISSQAWSP